MVNLTINNKAVTVPEGTTILEAARQAGIDIPHLCYLKKLNEIGACRVCCVEVEGERNLVPSCNNPVVEGMVIHTNSPRARRTRKINVELILSQHDCHCATCQRSGNCHLQTMANDLGILDNPYPRDLVTGVRALWPRDFPLYRDTNKCIKCMRCIQVCDKIQGVNVWDLSGTGSRTRVDVSRNRRIKESDCVLCGQCITHCPTGALRERSDTEKAFAAIEDPDRITVVQIAPAVRTAWGESLGLPPEKATVNRMAAALRALGFDYVFDTSFSADLTIMEEGTEFIRRFQAGETKDKPMFTSCCPGWVRYLKGHHHDLVGCLSTAKSPQQMFGAVAKNYFAQKIGVSPDKICSISIMPCVAKKAECALPTMHTEAGRDVDLALTTRELVRMLRAEHIHPETLEEEAFDSLLGRGGHLRRHRRRDGSRAAQRLLPGQRRKPAARRVPGGARRRRRVGRLDRSRVRPGRGHGAHGGGQRPGQHRPPAGSTARRSGPVRFCGGHGLPRRLRRRRRTAPEQGR